jgi:signal transduction histidine kinase
MNKTSSMAHELKTPLTIIKAQIDVLNQQESISLEDYQSTLSVIDRTVSKMANLLDTLLETSPEKSSLTEVLNIEEIILDVIEDLAVIANRKDIKLSYQINGYPESYGNPILMYRCLYNLVENAIKYNQNGGLVEIHCDTNPMNYSIKILDNGMGIPNENIDKIFKPYYRCEKTNKEGIGLGLAMVQSIVTMHKGQIHVTSQMNQGSQFILNFPYLKKDSLTP